MTSVNSMLNQFMTFFPRGLRAYTLLSGSVFLLALPTLPSHAHTNALKMSISASKVVEDKQGNPAYVPVRTAKVGTEIQYKATYKMN